MVRWARRRNERETLLLMFHFPVVFFSLEGPPFCFGFLFIFDFFVFWVSLFLFASVQFSCASFLLSLTERLAKRAAKFSPFPWHRHDCFLFVRRSQYERERRIENVAQKPVFYYFISFYCISYRVCVCVWLRYIDVTTRSSSNDHLGELVREPHVLSDLIQHWISIATSISSFFFTSLVSLYETIAGIILFYFLGGGGGRGWVVVSASFPTNVLVGQCGDDCARNSLWCVDSCRCDLSHSSTITRVQNPFGNEMREKTWMSFLLLLLEFIADGTFKYLLTWFACSPFPLFVVCQYHHYHFSSFHGRNVLDWFPASLIRCQLVFFFLNSSPFLPFSLYLHVEAQN